MQQQQNVKSYNLIVDFAKFLRENGHKLFEKGTKLCLNTEQIIVLQEYLIDNKQQSSKEYLLLCKSPHLYLIQDFLFKVTNVKISGNNQPHNLIKLNIFGSLTYLEIKNCQIVNIVGIQNLRSQLEVLICIKSITRVQDVLHFCGADQSSPLSWPKLHTLNLSYNQLTFLDNSFRLIPSLETLDLSHNSISECGGSLRNLTKLKKLDISFNKFEILPELNESNNEFEFLDISHNNIDKLDVRKLFLMNKLAYLNLSHNLIVDLKELYSLKNLQYLTQLKIENNPMTHNVLCDLIVDEIILSNKKEKLNKTTNQNNSLKSNQKYFRHSTISSSVPTRQKTYNSSEPIESSTNKSFKQKSNLKFRKRISTIRKVELAGDDDDDDNEGNKIDSESQLAMGSSPVNSDYDSHRLQKELEHLKTSRKLYGAQWLLSSPHLLTLPSSVDDRDIQKNPSKIETLKDIIEKNHEMKTNDLNSAIIIDSFAVKKIDISVDVEFSETKVCFLGLSEKYLIEKDEINQDINEFYEFIHFIDGKIEKESLDFSMDFEKNFDKVTCFYQFENEIELNNFSQCLFKVLLNDFNFDKCRLYLCNKCYFMGRKQNFFNQTNDLDCENCEAILVKDNKIQLDDDGDDKHKILISNSTRLRSMTNPDEQIGTLFQSQLNLENEELVVLNPEEIPMRSKSLTLRDVLRNYQQDVDKNIVEEDEVPVVLENVESSNIEEKNIIEDEVKIEITNADNSIEHILNNNQISKTQIDTSIKESYKVDNNLKLHFLMNVLNQNSSDDEKLISTFKLKLFILNDPDLCLINCLCVISNKNIFIYRIKDKLLFEKNSDFDKCLKNEFKISINLIEIIEISSGQHYLSIHTNDEKIISKLITFNVYETQAFSSVLLKIINESNDCTSLKQIRKKNQQTDQNLLSIIKQNDKFSGTIDLYTFIRYNLTDEPYSPEYRVNALFIHNDENFTLIEENLTYQQLSSKQIEQFRLVNNFKIIDIGNIRLFKDFETKLEINFLDESNNSKQVSLQFYVNDQFFLSQLIIKIKTIWEKIFFIELPISY